MCQIARPENHKETSFGFTVHHINTAVIVTVRPRVFQLFVDMFSISSRVVTSRALCRRGTIKNDTNISLFSIDDTCDVWNYHHWINKRHTWRHRLSHLRPRRCRPDCQWPPPLWYTRAEPALHTQWNAVRGPRVAQTRAIRRPHRTCRSLTATTVPMQPI